MSTLFMVFSERQELLWNEFEKAGGYATTDHLACKTGIFPYNVRSEMSDLEVHRYVDRHQLATCPTNGPHEAWEVR